MSSYLNQVFFYCNLSINEGNKFWKDDALVFLGCEPFPITLPVRWDSDPYSYRSWQRLLHTFCWIDKLIADYKYNKNIESMHTAVRYLLDWYQFSVKDDNSYAFRWKDDAVSFRVRRIAIIVRWALDDDNISEEMRADLIALAQLHLDNLLDSKLFQKNNHGLFQMRGLVTISTLLPQLNAADKAYSYAIEKINFLWKTQYGIENMHFENSPAYHLHIIREFEEILDSPEFKGAMFCFDMNDIEAVKSNLKYLFHPCGKGTLFGDSNIMDLDLPTVTGDHFFDETGYIILSGDMEHKLNSYLCLRAGFASNIHRHSDDFSFEWSEYGQVIITDSGKYSYDYDDPVRQYMTSTRAHNTVSVDDSQYPWWGDFKKNEFYSSAIQSYQKNDNISEVKIARLFKRLSVHFERNIYFDKGKTLRINDSLTSYSGMRKFIQWFHFSLDFVVAKISSDLYLAQSMDLHVLIRTPKSINSYLQKGLKEPFYQGWISLKEKHLEPNFVLGVEVDDEKCILSTTFNVFPKTNKLDELDSIPSSNQLSYFKNKFNRFIDTGIYPFDKNDIDNLNSMRNDEWMAFTNHYAVNANTGLEVSGFRVGEAFFLFAIAGNELHLKGSISFAFYLMSGGEKIRIQWYSSEPRCVLLVPDYQGYKDIRVVGFVMDSTGKKISKNRPIETFSI
ncbi:alginate lyase family protein [Aeromonas veronii]